MSSFGRMTAVAVVAMVAFANPASAQISNGFANTGQSSTGGLDNNWFVIYCPLDASGACASAPTSMGSGQAAIVAPGSLPSPPWYPNQPNAQWISVTSTASMPGAVGDGVMHYRYIFGTAFTSNTNSLSFAYNSDNFFHGWTILPGNGTPPFTDLASAFDASNWNDPTPAGTSGFCRSPDGAFGPPCPALSPTITTNNVATNGPNIMLFKLDGDGQTDGLFVTSTPEPGSLALLGTGLFGLVPMIRRRRKA